VGKQLTAAITANCQEGERGFQFGLEKIGSCRLYDGVDEIGPSVENSKGIAVK
jgi:hypothetical protein